MDAIRDDPNGMLWGLRFAEGRGRAITEPMFEAPGGQWTWTHFGLADVRGRAFLTGLADLPAEALELIVSRENRVQLHHEGGWAFGVLPDLERDLDGEAIDIGRLRFALDGRRLITTRGGPLMVVEDIRRRVLAGLVIEGPVAAFEVLVDRYLDVVERRTEQMAETLDLLEDRVLASDEAIDLLQLGPIRRELSSQRRELVSLRGAVGRAISARDGRRVSILVAPLTELAPLIEDLDREAVGLLERARLLHEEIDTRITTATNRNMRALTVMSTLLIPPTLIVGAFGMNVGGVPFAQSPAGFVLAVLLCGLTVVLAWRLLRRMKVL